MRLQTPKDARNQTSYAALPGSGRQHHRNAITCKCSPIPRVYACTFPEVFASSPEAATAHQPLRLRSPRQAVLEPQDYAFYNDMTADQVDEAFLWSRLEPHIQHLGCEEQAKLRDALALAKRAHDGQLRKSGEPFITHPVEVTRILAEIRSELEMLISGLLHDTVEDTDTVTLEDIGRLFGAGCQRIVEGETKFSKLTKLEKGTSKEELKAMDLQQLFLAMTEDARIIIVKLADRLHNMRTMASMPPVKQAKIANETLRVFAPLAGLLGLWTVKTELEDLSLQYSRPKVFQMLHKHREKLLEDQKQGMNEAEATLRSKLLEETAQVAIGSPVDVSPRVRSIYSLFQRARRQLESHMPGIPLDDVPEKRMCELLKQHRALDSITDVIKFYVVIKDPCPTEPLSTRTPASPTQLCYQLLGVLHAMWPPVPRSIKDYISTPKQNGYQGLHSMLLTLGCSTVRSVEVIIHTEDMHRRADYGIVADTWPRALTSRAQESPTPPPPPPPEQTQDAVVPWDPLGLRYIFAPSPSQRTETCAPDAAEFAHHPSPSCDAVPYANRHSNGSSVRNGPPGQVNGFEHPSSLNGSAVSNRLGSAEIARRVNWLQSIRQWQEEFLGAVTAREFMEVMQRDLLSRTIFTFTPAGDIMRLPKGATVVDFAYHVHTEVGNSMVSARVNGVVAQPGYELQNADVVEILQYSHSCSNAGHIKRHRRWLQQARTQSVRHKIQKFLREAEREVPSADPPEDVPPSPMPPSAMPQTWISINCNDRSGILGEVATTIAKHGHNILAYNGGNDRHSTTAGFMNFCIDAEPGQLVTVFRDLEEITAVTSVDLA